MEKLKAALTKHLLAAASLVLLPATLIAAPPAAGPSTTWVVNVSPDQCALIRLVGSAPIFELILAPRSSETGELWLLKPPGTDLPEGEVSFTFQPGGSTSKAVGQPLTKGAMRYRFDDPFFDRFGAATRLTASHEGVQFLDFRMPGAGKALAALRSCYDELLSSWGVDPALMASLKRKPAPFDPAVSWVRAEDYPTDAIRSEQSGKVIVRVTVGPDGRPAGCVTVFTSESASLDQATCRIVMNRGRYQPALGADGRPTSAPALYAVTWTLPPG